MFFTNSLMEQRTLDARGVLLVYFVLCSQVIEVNKSPKGFTCRDAFQRQELLPQSMLQFCKMDHIKD